MRGVVAGLLALLMGCAAQPAAAPVCDFPGARPMLVAELFFGRGDAGKLSISDAEWNRFVADTLGAQFPDGFTATDTSGQWREAEGRPVVREAGKHVLIAAADAPATLLHLRWVIAEYLRRFDQKSVGLILDRRCASF